MFTYKALNENKVLKSNTINNAFRDIFNDLSDLHLKSVTAQINQSMILDVMNSYSTAMSNLVDDLQTQVATIDQKYNLHTLYSTTDVLYPTANVPRANHEPAFGRATLKLFSRKLIYATLDSVGKYKTIDNLTDYLNWYTVDHIASDAFDRILENEVEKAFDQDPNTIFYRRLETMDDNQSSADLIMEMSLPAGEQVNSLRIHPFPESYIDIDSIKYSTSSNEENYFVSKDGFDISESFQNSRKIALSFQSVKPSTISIKLKQNNKAGLNPYYFMLGFHNISLAYELYENISYIGFRIKKPTGKTQIIKLLSNLTENGETDLDTGASYYVFSDIADFNEVNIDNAIYNSDNGVRVSAGTNSIPVSVSVSDVYVLVKLIKDANENTPVLKTLTIEWDD